MATMLGHAEKMLRGEVPPPPITRLLGFVVKSVEPGRAVFEMEVDERYHNPLGTLHGGVYCDLADAAMGYAYAATLADGETFTTVELKINFLRAVRTGRLPPRPGSSRQAAPWASSSAMSPIRPASCWHGHQAPA